MSSGAKVAARGGTAKRRSGAPALTAAVIDQDQWVRSGRAAALDGSDGVDLAVAASVDEVVDGHHDWDAIDVVVVDPYVGPGRFDRYAGVTAIEHIRASSSGSGPVVVALSEHVRDPFLRLRLQRAGADYAYCRYEASDLRSLLAVITRPDSHHRLDAGRHDGLPGLGPCGRPGALLRLLEEEGVGDAFAPGTTQAESGLSRRTTIRLRRLAATVGGIETAAHRRSGGPADIGVLPTWREVVDQVNRLRGVSEEPEGAGPVIYLP